MVLPVFLIKHQLIILHVLGNIYIYQTFVTQKITRF